MLATFTPVPYSDRVSQILDTHLIDGYVPGVALVLNVFHSILFYLYRITIKVGAHMHFAACVI